MIKNSVWIIMLLLMLGCTKPNQEKYSIPKECISNNTEGHVLALGKLCSTNADCINYMNSISNNSDWLLLIKSKYTSYEIKCIETKYVETGRSCKVVKDCYSYILEKESRFAEEYNDWKTVFRCNKGKCEITELSYKLKPYPLSIW